MNKPPVLPELYTGEKSWDEWYDHFDSIATVCEWDDAAKLSWLRVRLSGRAATTLSRLPEETRVNFRYSNKSTVGTLWTREQERTVYGWTADSNEEAEWGLGCLWRGLETTGWQGIPWFGGRSKGKVCHESVSYSAYQSTGWLQCKAG